MTIRIEFRGRGDAVGTERSAPELGPTFAEISFKLATHTECKFVLGQYTLGVVDFLEQVEGTVHTYM